MTQRKDDQHLYLPDTEHLAEMSRLMGQGALLTHMGGGLLPEYPDLARFSFVLDAACGPGEWALEYAFKSPTTEVVGFDISERMIAYATEQAKEMGLENAHFQVMDIRLPLDFSDASFDLVNARTIAGVMPGAIWPQFVQEAARIMRPGGVIRLTETDNWSITNSPAFQELCHLAYAVGHKMGVGFSPDGSDLGITNMLGKFLSDAGCETIRERAFSINYSASAEAHMSMYREQSAFLRLAKDKLLARSPFNPARYDQLLERLDEEMTSPDFRAISYFLTCCAEKR
jgi:ubiquinone/menaquinone biosynthesis C-methylase UbiE